MTREDLHEMILGAGQHMANQLAEGMHDELGGEGERDVRLCTTAILMTREVVLRDGQPEFADVNWAIAPATAPWEVDALVYEVLRQREEQQVMMRELGE